MPKALTTVLAWIAGLFRAQRSRIRVRARAIDSRTRRIAAIAGRETMDPVEVEEALTLLAQRYPVTFDEVVTAADIHGLGDVEIAIEDMCRGRS